MNRILFLTLIFFCGSVVAEDWPQWLGPHRDGVWSESGILKEFPEGGPRTLWRAEVNAGYSGPAVADQRVFVTDRTVDKKAEPREGGIGKVPGKERVLCFEAETGESLWTHEYDCTYQISYSLGPRTTPLVEDDRVYTFGAMGDLLCLNTQDGSVIWSHKIAKDYEFAAKFGVPVVWGWSAHPLIDGDQLIILVGGKKAGVVAFNKMTGKELWRAIDAEEIGYASPVVFEQDGKRQLIVWHDVAIQGLDISTGEVLWRVPFPEDGNPQRPAVPISHPRLFGNRLFVSTFYEGSMLLEIETAPPDAQVVWSSPKDIGNHKDSLNTLMAAAIVVDDHIYGQAGNGELRCLNAATGDVVWRDLTLTGGRSAMFATTFIIPNGDRYFMYTDQGELLITTLDPKGFQELDRTKLLETTGFARGREIVWSHPAFANKRIYARNDKELICVDLAM